MPETTMQTKLCPKCGAVNSENADTCECGHDFRQEVSTDPVQDLIRSSLAGLLTGGPLNVTAVAIAAAVFWGGALFLMTWWLILWEGSTGETLFLGRLYFGYSVSPIGSIAGLLWGLLDGAISGAVIAAVYNVVLMRMSAKKGK